MNEIIEKSQNQISRLLFYHDQKIKEALRLEYKHKPLSDCDRVLFLLLSKSTKTTRAIHSLSSVGFVEDSFILIRSLLETLINMKYILLDTDFYPKLFLDFGFYDYYRKIEKLVNDKDVNSMLLDKYKDLLSKSDLQELDRIENARAKIAGRDDTWSKISIAEMADRCGLKSPYYDRVYFYLSQYSHPHIAGLSNYSTQIDGVVNFDDLPRFDGIGEALIITGDLYLLILELMLDYTKIVVDNSDFERIKKDMSNLLKSCNDGINTD